MDEMGRLRFSADGEHLICFLVLLLSFFPIAAEYYFHFPPSGFDFYQMAAYETYIRRDFGTKCILFLLLQLSCAPIYFFDETPIKDFSLGLGINSNPTNQPLNFNLNLASALFLSMVT